MKKLIFLPIVFILLIIFSVCDKPDKPHIQNDPPVLSDVRAPDSLIRGGDTSEVYLVSVKATDPDGQGDIDWVYFKSTRPDGTSDTTRYTLNDYGQMGDSAVGDGRYSTGIKNPRANAQLGNWIFTFYARDKQGNMSNNPSDTITVY